MTPCGFWGQGRKVIQPLQVSLGGPQAHVKSLATSRPACGETVWRATERPEEPQLFQPQPGIGHERGGAQEMSLVQPLLDLDHTDPKTEPPIWAQSTRTFMNKINNCYCLTPRLGGVCFASISNRILGNLASASSVSMTKRKRTHAHQVWPSGSLFSMWAITYHLARKQALFISRLLSFNWKGR